MTTTKLAILTVNAGLQPALVIDPGSHLAVGKIVSALKQMRTGLWTSVHETTVTITPSAGKECELYKLAWSLPQKGYQLEETPQHKQLDELKAQRKAQIQERVAQAAIPPMGWAAKRFSFRPHICGTQVSFFSKGDFTRWSQGHGIQVIYLGEHHAIIPHLPRGCSFKYDRTEKCAWCQPPVPSPAAEPPAADPEPTPDSTWTTPQIKDWCEAHGITTVGLRRKAELLELIQEVQG